MPPVGVNDVVADRRPVVRGWRTGRGGSRYIVGVSDAIHAKLEDVRRKLLDLTRRNRLLNHRDAGRRTLRVLDGEDAQHAYDRLVGQGKTMQFGERPEARESEANTPAEDAAEGEGMPPA